MIKPRLRSKASEEPVISPEESLVDPALAPDAVVKGRTPGRHAQVAPASALRRWDARKTFTTILTTVQKRLADDSQAPAIPKATDMLDRRESLWTWCARVALTPAFGFAVVAYLIGAWAIAGVVAYTQPEPTPTAQDGFDPTTGRWTLADIPSAPGQAGSPGAYAPVDPGSRIQPDYLTKVNQIFDDMGGQPIPAQPPTPPTEYPLYPLLGIDPISPAPGEPVPTGTETLPPPPVIDPNAPAPTEVVPPPPPVTTPSEPPVGAPASEPAVPAPSATVQVPTTTATTAPEPVPPTTTAAPATEAPAAVAPSTTSAAPSAPPTEAVSPQPLGPAPGPAA